MHYIPAADRNQLHFTTLDEQIAPDNAVRVLDAFVEKLDLKQLQYDIKSLNNEGRPPYEPKVYLKLYLYGYLNGIRSSRKLERESQRNIEVQWLPGTLQPNYHSIADFRKNNSRALRNTFKLYVLFLKEAELIDGKTIAVDGTKVRASNSKKNNYNPKKIERHLKYIEEQTEHYLKQLDHNDREEQQGEKITEVKQKLERLKTQGIKYEALRDTLEASNEPQISTTDTDARALLVQGQVVEVSYNMQAAVDDKHKLIVATHTINRNDRNALSDIALEAKANLQATAITVISDKGYHNGRELSKCAAANIETICAQQEIVNSNEYGTTEDYVVSKFIYNESDDTYTCPAGETLRTQGTWHKKTREKDSYVFKKYRTPKCKTCAVKHLCTGRKKGGREIERSEYAKVVSENAARYKNNKALYRKRQELNEHIFGTIKRKWGYGYTDLRGLEKVNGEHSLIALVYNIRRTISILGVKVYLEKLKSWIPTDDDYKKASCTQTKVKRLEPHRAKIKTERSIAA
ncbi:MAG: IS1182 family transposase [Ignavibacterium sp.]|nr:IS1182 family transposase [Ignavibacterium sp.]